MLFQITVILTAVKIALAEESLCVGPVGNECYGLESNSGVATRIAGGVNAESHSRPFQVALYSDLDGAVGFCGGALISPDHVLTAAHCCQRGGRPADTIRAVLGAHSLYDRYENGRRTVNVQDVVVHPEWDADTYANDIALLKLASTAQITDTIEPVRLPYANITSFSFAGAAAIVSGWGIPAQGVTFIAPTLREKQMTVMTNELCGSFYFHTLAERVVCGFSPGSGTCKGDNGGPMTTFHSATNETILIGVASFVQQSGCNTELPSVFTRVQSYLPWIGEVAGLELP